jgi:hypothetical protein
MRKHLQSMNTRYQKRLGFVTLGIFLVALSFSQTIIFSDAAGDNVTLGTEGHVSIVNNPVLDGANGSSQSLFSDGAAWAGYTINCSVPITASTNKLYISFYNPNGFTENQVQLNFENPNQQWLSEAHPAGSADGWYERVIDLSSFEGETLNWLWIAPAGGEAGQIYFDNIYLADAPSDEVNQPFSISTTAVVFADAAGEYVTLGSEEQVSVVDNPVLDTINGSPSSLLSDGGAWEGYTINCAIPVTDSTNKLYISFYNPNGFTENQVQINFKTPNQQWLTEAYPVEAKDGWYERVIDLSSFVGDTLTWMWIAPSAGEAGQVYFDNIYLDDVSNEDITMPFVLSTSGIIFMDEPGEGVEMGSESHVSLVDNPMKDGVNDSEKSLKSDAQASWSGYTITCNIPISDTMSYFYISMYNPEDALENQVQVNFTTPNQQWLTEAFPDEATTGWYTRVIDLTAFIGDTLNWIWLAPTAGQTRVSYMDNMYIGGEPSSNTSIQRLNFNAGDVYYTQGVLRFKDITLENAEVTIYDVTGRIFQKETGNGNEITISSSVSNGVYIVQVVEGNQLKLQKKVFIQKQ